jgi:hypothetical protein
LLPGTDPQKPNSTTFLPFVALENSISNPSLYRGDDRFRTTKFEVRLHRWNNRQNMPAKPRQKNSNTAGALQCRLPRQQYPVATGGFIHPQGVNRVFSALKTAKIVSGNLIARQIPEN